MNIDWVGNITVMRINLCFTPTIPALLPAGAAASL